MAVREKLDLIRIEHFERMLLDQARRLEEVSQMVRATLAKPFIYRARRVSPARPGQSSARH